MKKRRPEWTPDNAGKEFASRIVSGSKDCDSIEDDGQAILVQRTEGAGSQQESDPLSGHTKSRNPRVLSIDILKAGILQCNRTYLSKAITLIESNSAKHFNQAQDLIKELQPFSGNSIRIGITGVPGAGKSTFIEAFGLWLIERGHRVAVLAIDPSSSVSKGSILGDKTRMEGLSRHPRSFIRPSPSSGILGGVARKTRETIILCEAAGYDIILVETIGVGQSEISVRSMVDFFVLMQIAGAGDELQGIKKGIMELADLLVVNKADGSNVQAAKRAQAELNQALHYIQPATSGWKTRAVICSALNRSGLAEVWQNISAFLELTDRTGQFALRRQTQIAQWFESMIEETLIRKFYDNEKIKPIYPQFRSKVLTGEIAPAAAVAKLFELVD